MQHILEPVSSAQPLWLAVYPASQPLNVLSVTRLTTSAHPNKTVSARRATSLLVQSASHVQPPFLAAWPAPHQVSAPVATPLATLHWWLDSANVQQAITTSTVQFADCVVTRWLDAPAASTVQYAPPVRLH